VKNGWSVRELDALGRTAPLGLVSQIEEVPDLETQVDVEVDQLRARRPDLTRERVAAESDHERACVEALDDTTLLDLFVVLLVENPADYPGN